MNEDTDRAARADSPPGPVTPRAASHRLIPWVRAAVRMASTVRAPMPRAGVLITRSSEASSWRLSTSRR
ncbi:hypothetical protein KBTX_04316 [wastewater metagenome]|uniref:Uncharacterized protein n=2 Tax=unclassified sequences TaxID=12908 RepID=A0A5B8RGE9_9ZZZZ|nr:hypothetical protein KBTEX_04316 [uncultured organism]